MRKHVVFVEPCFPRNQKQFVRGLHEVGAFVTGIGEAPREALPSDVKQWLDAYIQIGSVVREDLLHDAVKAVHQKRAVDRLEATVEAHVMAAARVREKLGIPGISVQTTYLCRDKPAMKEALRKADVPTAHSAGVNSAEELRAFVKKEGYPIIVKPRDAAGAAGTFKLDSDEDLERVLPQLHLDKGASVAAEEFVEGHEGFYDSISIDGKIVHDFATHYYPNVLEAMRTRWISPVFISTNRIESPGYQEVKALGTRVNEVLGIGTTATHMEWFFGPKGLKFSEIGCRPPGVGAWDLYRAGNDWDIYREWARAIVHGQTEGQPNRRFAAALINLRPDRDGVIDRIEGTDELGRRFGDCIIDLHLPNPGSPTQPIEAGYMANAWIRMRHPNYDTLREILTWVGENVKVRART